MLQMRTWIGLFLLTYLLVLSNASVSIAAQITDGFTYTESNGVVTITDYSGVSTVDIGASFPGATEIVIADRAFDGTTIISVVIPKNVTSIGEYAFADCDSLQTVTFEERTTEPLTFTGRTFNSCSNLLSLDIPDVVTTIPYYFANMCTALKSVELPSACQSIGFHAFDGCEALTCVTIPANCNTISEDAFKDCEGLTTVNFEEGTNETGEFVLGQSAFYGCTALNQMNSNEVGKVVLPTSCQAVGESAFYGCTSISKLYIPASCTALNKNAFSGCTGLSLISFDNADTTISEGALPTDNTSNITIYCNGDGNVINYYEGNTNITIVNTSSVNLTITQLPTKTDYYYEENGKLDIDGIKLIAERTENESTTQEEVAISDCLISGFDSEIAGEQTITVSYGGKTATFKVNVYYNMAKAVVEIDNTTYTGVRVQPYMAVTGKEMGTALIVNKDYVVSYSDNLNAGTATATISGMGLYKGEKSVEFKVLPKEITEANTTLVVADMDYTGQQLRPVPEVACGTEPLILDEDYVVTYGTNINVGKGFVIIEGIGNYDGTIKKWFAINEVSTEKDGNSTTTEDKGGETSSSNTQESNDAAGNQEQVQEIPQKGKTYTYKNLVYKVTGKSTVTFMKPVDKKIKKIAVPAKVKILGKFFKVTKVNKKACYKCKKLTTVTIGDNVTSIGDQAFAKCSKLKKVTIGKGLKKIGKKVFYKDERLKTLIIKSSNLTSVGKGTLQGVKGLNIQAPKKKVEKYKKLFKKAK